MIDLIDVIWDKKTDDGKLEMMVCVIKEDGKYVDTALIKIGNPAFGKPEYFKTKEQAITAAENAIKDHNAVAAKTEKEFYLLSKRKLRLVIILATVLTAAAIFAAILFYLAIKDFASGKTISVAIVKKAETVQAAPLKSCRKPPKPENDEAKTINYTWLKENGYDVGLAKKIAKEVRGVIDPRIAIAIAIKESSLGAAENGNNLFGVSIDEVGVSQGSDGRAIKGFVEIIETCGYYDKLSTSDSLSEQIEAMKKWNTKNDGYFADVKRLVGELTKGEK